MASNCPFLKERRVARAGPGQVVGLAFLFVGAESLFFETVGSRLNALDLAQALAISSGVGFGRLLIIAGVVVLILVLVYAWRVRAEFASVPRLQRPWSILGGGVTLLFLGLLFIAIKEVVESMMGRDVVFWEDVADAVIAISAFVILASMVMMKRAWMIQPGE